MGSFLIIWDPLLPLLVLALMAAGAALVIALGFLAPRMGHPAPGLIWRIMAITGILAALANPSVCRVISCDS